MSDENKSESTPCEDPKFYCEYGCDEGLWTLVGQNHTAGYYCVSTLPVPCSGSETTCASPVSKTGGSRLGIQSDREVTKNTGDYLFDGDNLHLLQARTDTKNFCPPTLSLDDIKNLPIAAELEKLAKDDSFVSVIVNLPANTIN